MQYSVCALNVREQWYVVQTGRPSRDCAAVNPARIVEMRRARTRIVSEDEICSMYVTLDIPNRSTNNIYRRKTKDR